MAQRQKVRIRGFTLVELLVVISIIGMLVGLLIPAIQMALERARWIVCTNNMRQLGEVIVSYEQRQGQYPGYQNVLMTKNGKPFVDPQTGKRSGVSFVVPLLQLLDRPDLYRAWASQGDANAGNAAQSRGNLKVRLDLLQCPSDPPTDRQSLSNSYVLNTGMQDTTASTTTPRDWPENGVFFDLYTGDPRVVQNGAANGPRTKMVTMSSAYVTRGDGLQNTFLISENVDAGEWADTTEAKVGMIWNGTGTVNVNTDPPNLSPPDDNMRINHGTGKSDLEDGVVRDSAHSAHGSANSSSKSTAFARPSSFHPGGVNVVFCDGRVQFFSDQVDYYVYCLLMSTNGEQVRLPGSNRVLPNFSVGVNDTWFK